jgi:DNA replication and repair protein RecF
VHLLHLRLRDFRNYARLDADFSAGFHLLLGDNAQGKTNILEAVYLLATLRSFRGVAGGQMVRHGQKGYFVSASVSSRTQHEIKIYWSPAQRKLSMNGQPVRKISDYLGVVRAVVFCTEDLQLIKGPGLPRRRYLDLLLAHTHSVYLTLLQRYARALRSRNILLRQPRPDEAAMDGFTHEVIASGRQIMKFRQELVPPLAGLASAAYGRVAHSSEALELEYQPSVKEDFAVELARNRAREKTFRTTIIGPHRDELQLRIEGKSAAKFASEGQKRSIAIALKLAQAEFLSSVHGVPPILLIDDVMGELDASRRAAFLPLLNRVEHARSQVFMTCTGENWPQELGRNLHRWQVRAGTLQHLD